MVAQRHDTSNPYMIHFGTDFPGTTDLDNASQADVRRLFASTASVYTSNPYLVLSDTHLDACAANLDFHTDGRITDAVSRVVKGGVKNVKQKVKHGAAQLADKTKDSAAQLADKTKYKIQKVHKKIKDFHDQVATAVEERANRTESQNEQDAETEIERKKKRAEQIAAAAAAAAAKKQDPNS